MPKSKVLSLLALVLGGGLSVFAFAPFGFFPAMWISLAVFLYSVSRAPNVKSAAFRAFVYGLGFYLANVYWVYISLHDYGGMNTVFSILSLMLLSSYLALFPMLAAYLSCKIPASFNIRLLILLPAFWTLAEWLRGTLFTGFPWANIGYSHVPDTSLAGFAPVLGVYGVGFLVISSVALVLWGCIFVRRHIRLALISVGALWVCGFGLRLIEWTKPCGKPLNISVVQGNIPQSLKWQPDMILDTFNTYLKLIKRSPGELILLPETAIPLFLQFLPDTMLFQLQSAAEGKALIAGVPSLDENKGQYYNSAVLLTDRNLPIYHKHHLVPFGEYVPFSSLMRWIVNALTIPLTDFSAGPARQLPFKIKDQFITVNICYEDIFGAEIANGAPLATILANISNLAWFDGSIAMAQHGQMAQARALETGRPMLRATNTGLTAMIDYRGHFIAQLPLEKEAILTASIQGRCGSTPYLYLKDVGVLILITVLLLFGLFLSWRYKYQART